MTAVRTTRYTDRDVIENEDLTDAAYEWLEQYEGSYPFLLDAKKMLLRNGELRVPVVRGVLNCMRNDPTAELPALAPAPPTGPGSWGNRSIARQELERRFPYDLPNPRWKGRLIYSSHPKAYLVHKLDVNKSTIRYFPAVWEFRTFIIPVCGARISDKTLNLTDIAPPDYINCQKCYYEEIV